MTGADRWTVDAAALAEALRMTVAAWVQGNGLGLPKGTGRRESTAPAESAAITVREPWRPRGRAVCPRRPASAVSTGARPRPQGWL